MRARARARTHTHTHLATRAHEARESAISIKLELGELAETRRVIVAHSLGVSERLEQRVALDHLPAEDEGAP